MSDFSARRVASVVGLVIGLILGLVYQWGLAPVELVNTYPALLRTDHRWDWVRIAALSYTADGDLERVRVRLDGLDHDDVEDALAALIEEYAAAGRPAATLRRLTTLAEALDVHTSAMLVYQHTPGPSPLSPTRTPASSATPTPTLTPTLTIIPTYTPTPYVPSPLRTPTLTPTSTLLTLTLTLTPTLTPTPTPTPPFLHRLELTERQQICEPGQPARIEVVVQDERGAGVAGVDIWLMWPGGADRAVTGLKPQHGAGYADFEAEPDVRYSLGVGELGMALVSNLRLEPCPVDEENEEIGSWRILLEPRSPENE
ncbi:MAG: hypothetical protein U9R15_10005 [Chloroflexota bacterium]|nr:hypothetical protein [Chloroflexota bacterium]